jgi:AraC-like DNA-binding protein
MGYLELAPEPRLAPWVHCVWLFEAPAPGESPERIVPDGRCELVVHFGAPFAEVDSRGRGRAQPAALFAGQVTRPLHLRATGVVGVVGVRFRPAGARAFTGFPMSEVTDRRVALSAMASRAARGLVTAIARAPSAAGRAALAQNFVWARIAAQGHRDDATVARCVEAIEESAGGVDVPGLCSIAGVGRRTLERRFGDAVGIGPSLLASIFRFRRVFDVIEHDSARPWTDAAIEAGYYDQSHFIRDFRRFVGCTPSQFRGGDEGLGAALVER